MKNFLIIPFFTFLLGSDMTVFSKPFYECDEKKYSTEYLIKNSMSGILIIENINAKNEIEGIGSGFIVGYQDDSTLIITNSHVINGTDLTSSISAVQIILIIGKVEVLPSASITPKGKDMAMPKNARTQVNAKPP